MPVNFIWKNYLSISSFKIMGVLGSFSTLPIGKSHYKSSSINMKKRKIMSEIGFVASLEIPTNSNEIIRMKALLHWMDAKLLQQIWCTVQFHFVTAQFTQVFKYNRQFSQNYGDKKAVLAILLLPSFAVVDELSASECWAIFIYTSICISILLFPLSTHAQWFMQC